MSGDINFDSILNVLDVVILVNFILEVDTPDSDQFTAGDINSDGILNVLDIVNLSLLYPEQFMLADHNFVLDINRLEKDLGFKPKFNDEDMLYKAYESYLEKF